MKRIIFTAILAFSCLFSQADVIVTANGGILNRYKYVYEWNDQGVTRLNCFNPGFNRCGLKANLERKIYVENDVDINDVIDFILENAFKSENSKMKGVYLGVKYSWSKYKSSPDLKVADSVRLVIIN